MNSRKVSRDKQDSVRQLETANLAGHEQYLEVLLAVVLFAFGVYNSFLYFGHTIVPNSDFPAFFKTGEELLSLQIPSSFKRTPVLGLLQVLLSYLVGGQHPGLTAGWLLNAILHPFNLVLLWLVGKRIAGKSALWIAIIAILNPWVIYLLTEPIAETTLVFFTLLTFYLMFKNSRWCYLFASITMMVRYEGAALILAAFVMDMIYNKNRQERLRAFIYSALATIPLVVWMLGTFMNQQSESYLTLFGEDYAKFYAEPAEERTGFLIHVDVLWRTGFHPLLMPFYGVGQDFLELFWKLSKAFVIVSFVFGSVYGLFKRQWKILALLIFFVPYFWIHMKFPSPLSRYHMPIVWIALLICWFGLQSIWKLIDSNNRVPRWIVLTLQGLTVAITIIWFALLLPHLPKISSISRTSASLPYVAMTLVALIFIARVFVHKFKYFLREFAILATMCLVITSNQFSLVRLVGDGQKEKEFNLLADWYVNNTKPCEKMAVYMATVVKIFAPKHADYIVPPPKADNPSEFVKACYEENITYVVWATRERQGTDHTGYRQLGLYKNMAVLSKPKDIGPYQFVTQVGSERGYVNIFRLRKPPEGLQQ